MTALPAYLPAGLPIPVAEPNGLSAPFWDGLRSERLMVQRNPATGRHQFPPQWLCQDTREFDPEWVEVAGRGRIFSWTRIWHPVHPALKGHGPYIVVIVELLHADHVRMVGNLVGDPMQDVEIGSEVEVVYEHHPDADPPYTLAQWRLNGKA